MSKGFVKGVLSGDTIIISGALSKDYSLPEEFNLTLTGVFAPKIGNSSKLEEEPFSFESREFLRKLIIGKVVIYKVDYTHNERKFGHIKYENKLINAEVLRNGFAKIGFLPKAQENLYKSEMWTSLKEAEKEGINNKRGIYQEKGEKEDEKEESNKHVRQLGNLTDMEEAQKKIKEIIEKGDEIDAIVEHVFNTAMVSVYIPSLSCFAKVNLRFVQIPSNTKDPELFKIGKAKSERLCLNHDVKLKIFDIDEGINLIGDIHLLIEKKDQNLAQYLLKTGFCKSFTGGNKNPKVFNLTDINIARAAENEAKAKRAGLWKNENIPEIKKIKKENEEDLSQARCVMVNSGDSLTVLNKKNEEVRIFLSNLKAPAMARFGSDEQNKPWAFQSKEFIRKKLVGKILMCDLDYIHTINVENIPKKEDTRRVMKFYTVYYQNEKGENKCINVELIENGLANLTNYKIEQGNPSKEFDSMIKAEQEAKNQKVGLYSSKVPPLCTYSDLIVAGKTKKKEFINFLTGLKHMNCVIDFCFSASKFKLRLDEKQVMIPFNLIGIKAFQNDKNNSSLFQKYYKISHDYVVKNLLQRDAICDIIQSDKMGNYFGNLTFTKDYFDNTTNNKENLGTILIEKGFAVVSERSYDVGKNRYIDQMKNAEKKAMEDKVGLWADEGLAKLLKGEDSIDTSNTISKFEKIDKDIKIRITDEIDLDKFFCNFLPNKTLDKIEEILADYDEGIEKAERLSPPIKQGTLCAARFPEDDKYYRAVIKKFNKEKNEYQVEFIDYGNIEWVKLHDLIKLDGKISSLPPQAMICGLAYMKYSKISMRKAVNKYPNFVDFENELNAKLCYSYKRGGETKYGLIVFKEGKDMKKTYHADLLKEGLAKLNRNSELPEYMKDLDPIEQDAELKEIGVWDDNEETDYGQNDDDY